MGSPHTAEQIIGKLKTAEQLIAQGKTVADVRRVIEVTQPTYHGWRQSCSEPANNCAKALILLHRSCNSWQVNPIAVSQRPGYLKFTRAKKLKHDEAFFMISDHVCRWTIVPLIIPQLHRTIPQSHYTACPLEQVSCFPSAA